MKASVAEGRPILVLAVFKIQAAKWLIRNAITLKRKIKMINI
jgi:hypothetical protein